MELIYNNLAININFKIYQLDMVSISSKLLLVTILSIQLAIVSSLQGTQTNLDIPETQVLASDFFSGSNVLAVLTKSLGLRVYKWDQYYSLINEVSTCDASSISIMHPIVQESSKLQIKVSCENTNKIYEIDFLNKQMNDVTEKISSYPTRTVRLLANGTCTTVVSTGNGTYVCGDGNAANGDGCSASCQVEFCGDAVVNNNGKQACDDGNSVSGDGCFNCALQCGNGYLNFGEQCDDGNLVNGDGCSATCKRQTSAAAVPLAVGLPLVGVAIIGVIVAKCLLAKSAASQGAAYAAQGAYAPQGAYVAQGQGLQVEETTKVLKY